MRRLAIVPLSTRWMTALAVIIHLAVALPAGAQETRYIYDALGRLVGVVTPDGLLTVYEYDPAGNLLVVRRVAPEGNPAITLVTPGAGLPGTSVEIFGAGFSAVAAGNQVAFNGTAADVLAATATRLLTRVPEGGTSGFITVTVAAGSAESPERFLIPSMAISPTSATLQLAQTRQFTATVEETTDQRVTWAVNGIDGGNATIGTITTGGVYTAPTVMPDPSTVEVRATSLKFATLSAAATVEVIPQLFALTAMPDVRILRPAPGSGLNVTLARPSDATVLRPTADGTGSLKAGMAVAAPTLIEVLRPAPATGLNLILAAPPAISVLRPGLDGTGAPGSPPNTTVAQPHHTEIRPE